VTDLFKVRWERVDDAQQTKAAFNSVFMFPGVIAKFRGNRWPTSIVHERSPERPNNMNSQERRKQNLVEDRNRDEDVVRLQAEFLRVQDLHLRALADLENFRKKVQQDHSRIAYLGKRDILLKILEVVDSFDRALERTAGLPDSLAEGFQVISKQLQSILKGEGVTPMETLGQAFDPELHEAIATVGVGSETLGTIVAELSRGYLWQDQLLRPAKVSVAQ